MVLRGAAALLLVLGCHATEPGAAPREADGVSEYPAPSGEGNPSQSAEGAAGGAEQTAQRPAAGAGPGTEPSPEEAPRAILAEFDFVVRRFHWEIGGHDGVLFEGDRLTVVTPQMERMPDGSYTPYWQKFEAPLLEADREALRVSLEANHFTALEPLYIDRSIEDGAHSSYQLRQGGETTTVACSNLFPEPIQRIQAEVRRIAESVPREGGERLERPALREFWAAHFEE